MFALHFPSYGRISRAAHTSVILCKLLGNLQHVDDTPVMVPGDGMTGCLRFSRAAHACHGCVRVGVAVESLELQGPPPPLTVRIS